MTNDPYYQNLRISAIGRNERPSDLEDSAERSLARFGSVISAGVFEKCISQILPPREVKTEAREKSSLAGPALDVSRIEQVHQSSAQR